MARVCIPSLLTLAMQPSVFELLKTSSKDCVFVFIIVHRECQSTTHFQIETSETMTAAFEESGKQMIFTKSPSIMATNVLYNDPVEFDCIAKLIAHDLATSVIYIDNPGLAKDLLEVALKMPREIV
ncbi:hypothetical protein P692DRAFT_20837136 [Suillus brevipes Sb2]|nr:hypothetical protein P692DRAFT_20837136 [Suillus brevipes Sb2]